MGENALAEHVARVNSSDRTVWLGKLCWYTVSDLCVSHGEVLKGLTAVGLASHVPPYPRDFDVFRRVSSKAQVRKVPTPVDGVFENYLIREVAGRGESVVTRRIVVETVDRKGKTLDYRQLRDIEFHKDTAAIVITDLPANAQVKNTTAHTITETVKREFDSWKGKLNSYAIREFIRKMVLNMGATLVREGGGVYFLTEKQSATVDALETFVNDLPGECSFHSLALLDDKKQRHMVRQAFVSESSDAVDRMMGEIAEIQRSDKPITSDRYAGMVTEFQNIWGRTGELEELLETELGETKSRLSLFQTAIVGLRTKVKE